MRKELTDIYLRALKPPSTGRLEINDTACRNLQLRLTATGVATWSLRYTVGAKVKRTNLGHYPVMTLKQARARANAERGKIIQLQLNSGLSLPSEQQSDTGIFTLC